MRLPLKWMCCRNLWPHVITEYLQREFPLIPSFPRRSNININDFNKRLMEIFGNRTIRQVSRFEVKTVGNDLVHYNRDNTIKLWSNIHFKVRLLPGNRPELPSPTNPSTSNTPSQPKTKHYKPVQQPIIKRWKITAGFRFIILYQPLSFKSSDILTSMNRLTRSIKLISYFNNTAQYDKNKDFDKMFTEKSTWNPSDEKVSLNARETIEKI